MTRKFLLLINLQYQLLLTV